MPDNRPKQPKNAGAEERSAEEQVEAQKRMDKADAKRDADQKEADKNVAAGRHTNLSDDTRKSRERSAEKTAANIRNSTSNDGAPDKPDDNTKDRDKFLKRLADLREELYELDLELTKVGERELADVVKRARREFELVERRGIPQARGL